MDKPHILKLPDPPHFSTQSKVTYNQTRLTIKGPHEVIGLEELVSD